MEMIERIFAVLILGITSLWLSSCRAARPLSPPSTDTKSASTESVERALMQMERDWADAIVKHDAAAVSRITAEDWRETGWDGQSFGKAEALADLPLGTTESITMDPITVRVFGDVAIVTTGDTEKSTYKGKDSSGHYVWTDVYMKRNGQWQAVATQGSRVPPSTQ
jgi:ketosteroid isomerase-like protein